MRVLVTGATSLIGRHTVDTLVEHGHDVTTFQRGEGPGARSIRGSIIDPDAVARACDGQDAVIHLAAKVGVTGTRAEYELTNVGGTELLLDAAATGGVTRFVHVSSPSVAHAGEPLVGAGADPADPTGTRGHYATTKAMAEIVALGASTATMPVVAIRPHLVWGPGDTQLIGRIVERARQGRLALVGSGNALIDTTYVTNAADALDYQGRLGLPSPGIDWRPRHVPTGVATAGGSVAERVWDRLGRIDVPPMTSFLAEQLSTAHWFDQREARTALRWEPAVSLADGFDRLRRSFGRA